MSGLSNHTIFFCSQASVVYRRRLSFVVVCNAVGELAGRPLGAWAIGQPTLHGGPVRLRPVRTTLCSVCMSVSRIFPTKLIVNIFSWTLGRKFAWDLEQSTFSEWTVSPTSGFYAPFNFAPMSTTESNNEIKWINEIRATFVHFSYLHWYYKTKLASVYDMIQYDTVD